MYETMILTLDVEPFDDGRKVAEHMENEKFDSHAELLERLDSELGSYAEDRNEYNVQLWSLTDFMDACNNEEINLVNIWIGYVHLKKV